MQRQQQGNGGRFGGGGGGGGGDDDRFAQHHPVRPQHPDEFLQVQEGLERMLLTSQAGLGLLPGLSDWLPGEHTGCHPTEPCFD
jgi:hypothetical protein